MRLLRPLAMVKIATLLLALLLPGCVSHERQPVPLPAVDIGIVPRQHVTIALLGATGMAGGFILQEALAQGYDVRALARTPQKLQRFEDQITIIKGDALDPASIETLLQGSDVVISALGPVKADGDAAKMINTRVTELILQVMPKHNITRYIAVSGAAVVMPGDDRSFTGWLIRQMAAITLYDALQDKQAEYELLADSSVQWTLVRCPLIEPESSQQIPRASLETPTSFTLRAGELAQFVIAQIGSGEFIRKGPFLESR